MIATRRGVAVRAARREGLVLFAAMPSIDASGRSIHYLDEGSGPAVLFAHGFFMDATMFAPQMKAFRDTRRVISWDLRGHGQSPADRAPFTYWDQAADGFDLMDALGIEAATVVGMSQGGYIALRMALAQPSRVDRLGLIDTQAVAASAEEKAGYGALFEQWLAHGPTDETGSALGAADRGGARACRGVGRAVATTRPRADPVCRRLHPEPRRHYRSPRGHHVPRRHHSRVGGPGNPGVRS